MSLDDARAVYPLLVRLARELSEAIQAGRTGQWITYDDLCRRCEEELGIKETPRTVLARRLRPLQEACLQQDKPDLTAIVIQKPRSRSDSGELLRPSDSWWDPYIERNEVEAVDVRFWFERYRTARDFEDWPEEPFF